MRRESSILVNHSKADRLEQVVFIILALSFSPIMSFLPDIGILTGNSKKSVGSRENLNLRS